MGRPPDLAVHTPDPGESRLLRCGALAIVLAVVVAYQNTYDVPWLHDDLPGICENLSIQKSSSMTPGALLSSARPLTLLTFAANFRLGGFEVRGYHLVNTALHAVTALLLLGVVRRTLRSAPLRDEWAGASSRIAITTALLWSVHPLLTESITYIWQRAESLMGLFYLLMLLASIRGASDPRPRWTLLAVTAFLLGMAAKPVMITGPILVLLHDRQFGAGSFRAAFTRRPGLYAGLFLPWLATLGAGLWLASRTESAGFSVTQITGERYLLTECGVLLHYLRLCVWPSGLCFDPLWPIASSARDVLPQLVVVTLLALLTLAGAVKRRPASFLGLWFFLILAPTSSVMPLWDAAAEHRLYLPSAAVLLGLTLALHRALAPTPAARITWPLAAAVLALLLARETFRRNDLYRDPIALWTDTTRKAPWNPRAHANRATLLAGAGRTAEAIEAFHTALTLKPDLALARANLGVLLAQQGRLAEAIAAEETALRHDHTSWSIPYNLAHFLLRAGRTTEAIPLIHRAVQLNPYASFLYLEFPELLARAGRLPEAIEVADKGVRHLPDDASVRAARANLTMATTRGP